MKKRETEREKGRKREGERGTKKKREMTTLCLETEFNITKTWLCGSRKLLKSYVKRNHSVYLFFPVVSVAGRALDGNPACSPEQRDSMHYDHNFCPNLKALQ